MGDRQTNGPPQDGCENCGFHPLTRFDVPDLSTMWYCRRCRLYQQGQNIGPEIYSLRYHDGYASKRKHKLRTASARLNQVAGLIDQGEPRLLDIGCSLGYTVEAAVERGWDAYGADISAEVVQSCRDRGLNCHLSDGQRLPFGDASFDVVTAWHVIEHVTNVAETLREWRRVLKDHGLLALETPDSSCLKVRLRGTAYRRFWQPEHTYTFCPQNLVPMVTAAGFQVVRRPILGPWRQMRPGLTAYSLGYQIHNAIMRLAGLRKAFQIFCRRVPDEAGSNTVRFQPRRVPVPAQPSALRKSA